MLRSGSPVITGAGSIGLAWGAARRFRLIPAIAGPDVAATLDVLIQQWREHLADAHDTDGDDTAAGVAWPSRDAEGIRVLPGAARSRRRASHPL
jgi:hypothetical protein